MEIGIDASRIAVQGRTGTEHYSYELLAALAQIDHLNQYRLYCNQLPDGLPPLSPNFRLRQIPFPRLWTHARLSAELIANPPDALFVPAHVMPLGTPLRHMRSVVTIHDMGYLHFPQAHTKAHRLYLTYSTIWSAKVASNVIAISEATRQDLIKYAKIPADKIKVVHHGVSPRFTPNSDPQQIKAVRERYQLGNAPYLVYVGTVQPRKNITRLIEAFATVIADLPSDLAQLQLVIAGKRGWLTEGIEQQAQTLNIADRVRFTGYVADDDLPSLISGAEGFVLPSLYEGFGMPVIEAMACGTPVVCSNSSALPEVAGDAAILVDPTSSEAIAQGITQLVHNPQLRADLRERGLQRAAQFSWQRCARETLAILRG